MRIFAKKAFRFEIGGESCQVKPLAFADIDDKFADCLIFKLGQQDGDIEIIESAAKQKELENKPGLASRGGKGNKPKDKEPGGNEPEKDGPPKEPGDAE